MCDEVIGLALCSGFVALTGSGCFSNQWCGMACDGRCGVMTISSGVLPNFCERLVGWLWRLFLIFVDGASTNFVGTKNLVVLSAAWEVCC